MGSGGWGYLRRGPRSERGGRGEGSVSGVGSGRGGRGVGSVSSGSGIEVRSSKGLKVVKNGKVRWWRFRTWL